MEAIKNPIAIDLANEVIKTVAPNNIVNDTLDRTGELLQLQEYFRRREERAAKKAAEKAAEKAAAKAAAKAEKAEKAAKKAAEKAAVIGETTGMEKMIIAAIQSNAQPQVIEAMVNTAGITEARLIQLKQQAQDMK